jgi:hypothetical protein
MAAAETGAPRGCHRRERKPAPQGPQLNKPVHRAPGLMLGFPVTQSGDVAGASAEGAKPPPPVPVTLDALNARFGLQTSLNGPLLRVKGAAGGTPADGSAGGLSVATTSELRRCADELRTRVPGARFALLMFQSAEADKDATVSDSAGVRATAAGRVLAECGTVGFDAQVLSLLVRGTTLRRGPRRRQRARRHARCTGC